MFRPLWETTQLLPSWPEATLNLLHTCNNKIVVTLAHVLAAFVNVDISLFSVFYILFLLLKSGLAHLCMNLVYTWLRGLLQLLLGGMMSDTLLSN